MKNGLHGLLCITALLFPWSRSNSQDADLRQNQQNMIDSLPLIHEYHRSLVSDAGVMRVHNGTQLMWGVLDPTVHTVVLTGSVTLERESIMRLVQLLYVTPPFTLSRNLTIRGDPALPSWPTVDLAFVKGLVRLYDGVRVTLTSLVAINYRRDHQTRVLGFDLLTPTVNGTSYIVLQDMGVVFPACYNAEDQLRSLYSLPQPPWAPTPHLETPVPQDGCTNDTNQPLARRCWPMMAFLHTFAAYCSDDVNGVAVPNNITMDFTRVSGYCEQVVTEECVRREGSEYFCILSMIQDAALKDQMLPPPLASLPVSSPANDVSARADTGAGDGGSGINVALIAGLVGGLAGAALVALVIAAVVLVRRKRRQQQQRCDNSRAGSATSSSKDPSPAPGCGNSSHPSSSSDKLRTRSSQTFKPIQGDSPSSGTEPSVAGQDPETQLPAPLPEPYADGRRQDGHTVGLSAADDVPVTLKVPTRSDLQLDIHLDNRGLLEGLGGSSAAGTVASAANQERINDSGANHMDQSDGNFNVVKLLPVVRGKGSFGRVVEGLYDGQRVAVKILGELHTEETPSASSMRTFEQELQVLGRCQHPNVVRLLAACVQPPRLCLVLELMEASLEKMLYDNPCPKLRDQPLPLAKVLHISIEVCRALAYLHPTIVHRDLKPENVLVNDPWSDRPVVKLADFGLSRLRDTLVPTQHPELGTTAYMAPECFDVTNHVLCHKVDIYSLGVLLWEMLASLRPWHGFTRVAIAFAVTYSNCRPPLTAIPASRLSRKLGRLLAQCWDADPVRRPAASEVGKELTVALQQLKAEEDQGGDQVTPEASAPAYGGPAVGGGFEV